MTIKQELFCKLYVKTLDAARAYKDVYGCLESSARIGSNGLLKIDEIREYIGRLLMNANNLYQVTMPKKKNCTGCGKLFPNTNQYFSSNGRGSLRPKCKQCQKAERSKNKRYSDIKIQKELLHLSYSIKIYDDIYESMFNILENFQLMHFGDSEDFSYKIHLELIKGFMKKYNLDLLINKIENKYNLSISKEIDIMQLTDASFSDGEVWAECGGLCKTNFISLNLKAKNIFNELLDWNRHSQYKEYNFPIHIRVILKPNGKDFKYFETLEIE
jgi:hypothetical protein